MGPEDIGIGCMGIAQLIGYIAIPLLGDGWAAMEVSKKYERQRKSVLGTKMAMRMRVATSQAGSALDKIQQFVISDYLKMDGPCS